MEFKDLYDRQIGNQEMIVNMGLYDSEVYAELPSDNVQIASYHIQQLMSEIGEVLEADKRWKNFRNSRYDSKRKLDEIADCFIVLMNVSMFSGFNAEDIENAISAKIDVVKERISEI